MHVVDLLLFGKKKTLHETPFGFGKHFLLALCSGGSQRLDSVEVGEEKSTSEMDLLLDLLTQHRRRNDP